MKILLLLIAAVTISNAQKIIRPTYRPDSGRPRLILPTYRPNLDRRPFLIQPTYRPQPTPLRIHRVKRQLASSFPFYRNGPHTFSGKVFANPQLPVLNLGAGVDYAHRNGHGASLAASNNFNLTRLQRLPGTNVDLSGTYRLHQSRNGNTLDLNAGVSKTFSHLGNSAPYYRGGLTYRFH